MNDSGVKEVLLDKLVGLQDVEAAKRIEEMDTDLISECSEYIIELTGEELPSESVLEQMKQKLLLRLFGRNGKNPRYRKGLLRKILIAAIIVILLVAMSVSMMTLSGGDESLLSRWGYSVLGLKPGERIDFGDSFSIINNGENIEYKSVRQFVRKTGMDVLVPSKMPQGIKVKKVFRQHRTTGRKKEKNPG